MRIRPLVAAGFSFAPANTTVSQGTSVTWSFQGGTTTSRSFRDNTTAATGLFNPNRSATYQLRARTISTASNPDKNSGWSPVIARQIS